MSTTPVIALVPIDAGNWREAREVMVGDDQLPFVAAHQPVALVLLAKTAVGADGRSWIPLAITRDGAIVGVVGLAHRDGSGAIMHLAIDQQHQGQGIGTAAVRELVAYADQFGITELWLTVHDDNSVARALYERAGFAPTDEIRGGERVWRLARR